MEIKTVIIAIRPNSDGDNNLANINPMTNSTVIMDTCDTDDHNIPLRNFSLIVIYLESKFCKYS